jgi:hypothetical protein
MIRTNICEGFLKNGKRCRFQKRDGSYCKIHSPKETCSICYTNTTNFITSCNHRFCQNCIKTWLEMNDSCPCCRSPSTDHDLSRLGISRISEQEIDIEYFLSALERLYPNFINREYFARGQPFLTMTLESPINGTLRTSFQIL